MASRSNVYPCSSSMSQLICHALTLLYSWLHILIFTLNSHTFILHWNQLFNTNVPTQHELYTCTFCCSVTQCTSPFHTVVILLNYTTVLSFSLKYTGWVDVYSIFLSVNANTYPPRQIQSTQSRSTSLSRQASWQTDMRSLTNRMSRWFHRMLRNVQPFIRSVVALEAH